MDRAACLEFMYAKCLEERFIFRDAYMEAMYEWEVRPIIVGGLAVGVLAQCGAEIHIALDRAGAFAHGRRIIRECLTQGIAKHGHLTTRALRGDARAAQFLGRLGFYRVTEDNDCVHYRINETKIH